MMIRFQQAFQSSGSKAIEKALIEIDKMSRNTQCLNILVKTKELDVVIQIYCLTNF